MISALRKLRQEHQLFDANPPDIVKHCLNNIPALTPMSDWLFQTHRELRSDVYHI